MEEGEEDDPFGSIAKLCRISPSQESLLRRRRFLCQDRPPASSSSSEKNGNYQNLVFIQAESARIVVVSASESMEEEKSHTDGVFLTHPDRSRSSDEREDHPTVEEGCFRDADSCSTDRFPVVESERDADLGFLLENLKTMQVIEVDLGENAAFQSEDKVSMSVSSPVSQPLEGCFRDAGTVPVNSDSVDRFPVADSARDADLGLLQHNLKSMKVIEVDLEQNAAFQSEPDEARVSTSGSSPIEQPLEESPSKRLKITGVESPDSLPGSVQEKPREEIPYFFEKLNSRIVSSSPGNASAPTIKLVNPPPNPQSNDEDGEDTLTGREALMKSFEKLKSEIVSGDIESERNRCEMEKKKRVLPPSFNATTAAAASKTNVMNEAAAFSAPSSVNVTQGIAQNVMDSVVPIENENNQAEISLAGVLKTLGKDDPDNQNLRHLSIMEIARGRSMILTPSWWPKEGLEVKR